MTTRIKKLLINLSLPLDVLRIFAGLVLVFSFVNEVNAQSKMERGVIYTRDGSIFKGYIKKETEDTVYMLVLENQLIGIERTKIKKQIDAERFVYHKNGQFHYKKGIFWSGSLVAGPSTGGGDGGGGVAAMCGYRLNESFSFAGGIGIEGFSSFVGGFFIQSEFTSPFLYGRYYPPIPWRCRPFAYGRVGYGFGPFDEDNFASNTGGFQGQGGIGIHFPSTKLIRFVVSLGYHVQKSDGTQSFIDNFGNEAFVDYNLLIHQPMVTVSIEFR